MGSLYRPSTKTKAQEAAAALSPGKRKSEEERQLISLRIALQQTIWTLDPDSKLAKHLKLTMDEIRRHNLTTLLPASPINTSQESNTDRNGNTASIEAFGDSNMEEPVACTETTPEQAAHETGTEDFYEEQDHIPLDVSEKMATSSESKPTTRKRTMEDDEATMPLAKRVRTWIGGVFTSSA
ncbi:uncharacterized protein FFB20_13589 [Fusarium fujikuroi]|uniref:Uncharacterized protein n=2 Tax=Fusarium fujikuroi TaxID=5127 RepID=S0EN02_GIBF5|nr:uncharacterized protein FFUJ_14145 [Fusarium fujikuroi IMI 58289]KLO90082.1 uncharacterized protein Y057_8437 [Fusarium fujikuroi]KLP16866.1 uncharacterized protein LW94_9383 [Fusarium fujikuroi]QGI71404.1 hypothetical protein CEK27_003733 [Fusarium fujikuroi]QGI88734.1 hypothetical protein CEK25_003690 [Fusarium fujikuroi]QGJ02299.1 hypothetical protein CEK26_003743 [Fusarium fujikuroi]